MTIHHDAPLQPEEAVRATHRRRPRHPAAFTQAEVARVLRAAEQCGWERVEIAHGDVVVRLTHEPTQTDEHPFARGLDSIP